MASIFEAVRLLGRIAGAAWSLLKALPHVPSAWKVMQTRQRLIAEHQAKLNRWDPDRPRDSFAE